MLLPLTGTHAAEAGSIFFRCRVRLPNLSFLPFSSSMTVDPLPADSSTSLKNGSSTSSAPSGTSSSQTSIGLISLLNKGIAVKPVGSCAGELRSRASEPDWLLCTSSMTIKPSANRGLTSKGLNPNALENLSSAGKLSGIFPFIYWLTTLWPDHPHSSASFSWLRSGFAFFLSW